MKREAQLEEENLASKTEERQADNFLGGGGSNTNGVTQESSITQNEKEMPVRMAQDLAIIEEVVSTEGRPGHMCSDEAVDSARGRKPRVQDRG